MLVDEGNFYIMEIRGEALTDLHNADDAALISKTKQGLNNCVQVMNTRGEEHGLKMKAKKIEDVRAAADDDVAIRITIDRAELSTSPT